MSNNRRVNICKTDDCIKKVYGHGYCSRHYWQIRRHGKISGNASRIHSDPNEFVFENDICKIKLYDVFGNDKAETIIDSEDYEKVKSHKWCLDVYGYPKTVYQNNTLYLHRLITGNSKYETDHKDRNPLNNRNNNLRKCTPSQNGMNRKANTNSFSKHKGIDFTKGKWRALIQKDGKRYFLGTFIDEWKAALAYNEAAKKLHGEFALLNDL